MYCFSLRGTLASLSRTRFHGSTSSIVKPPRSSNSFSRNLQSLPIWRTASPIHSALFKTCVPSTSLLSPGIRKRCYAIDVTASATEKNGRVMYYLDFEKAKAAHRRNGILVVATAVIVGLMGYASVSSVASFERKRKAAYQLALEEKAHQQQALEDGRSETREIPDGEERKVPTSFFMRLYGLDKAPSEDSLSFSQVFITFIKIFVPLMLGALALAHKEFANTAVWKLVLCRDVHPYVNLYTHRVFGGAKMTTVAVKDIGDIVNMADGTPAIRLRGQRRTYKLSKKGTTYGDIKVLKAVVRNSVHTSATPQPADSMASTSSLRKTATKATAKTAKTTTTTTTTTTSATDSKAASNVPPEFRVKKIGNLNSKSKKE